jgi:hypothetical protein
VIEEAAAGAQPTNMHSIKMLTTKISQFIFFIVPLLR